MAQKFSDLTSLIEANSADADIFILDDDSATETKSISRAELDKRWFFGTNFEKLDMLTALTGSNVATGDKLLIGDADANLNKNITLHEAGIYKAVFALSDGANIATDCTNGSTFTVTLGGNRTLDNPTNKIVGKTYNWIITQDGSGGRTLAFGTDFDFDTTSQIRLGANSETTITGRVITSSKIMVSIAGQVDLIGSVGMHSSETPPTGWLECDGANVLRSTYVDLFAVIGTAYGTADGTHFNLPDMRGKFVRGWDNGQGNDPDAGTRIAQDTGGATGDNVGSVQSFAQKERDLKIEGGANPAVGGNSSRVEINDPGYGTSAETDTFLFSVSDVHNDTRNSDAAFSRIFKTGDFSLSEDRPLNVNVMYIIKY